VNEAVRSHGGERTKRLFDVLLSGSLLLVLSPLILACALVVWFADGRPVDYLQERVGRNGRTFRIVKFRTMRAGSGEHITVAADQRVTRGGRFLRRSKLDELPQLWNVLRGEMSLVGPRPEVPRYVAARERLYRTILKLRPGVTDWASLIFRDEEELLQEHRGDPGFYERVLLPRKLSLARLYRRERSLMLDAWLVAATMCVAVGLDAVALRMVGKRLVQRARVLATRHSAAGLVGRGRIRAQ